LKGKKTIIQALIYFTFLMNVCFLHAKPPVTEAETDPVMLDLDPYMIEALRSNNLNGRWGTKGSMVQLMKEEAFQKLIKKHDLRIFNGPMLGDIKATSVKVWIRTAGEAKFKIKVGEILSNEITTTEASDFTGIAEINGLNSFTTYQYSILIDGIEIKKNYYNFKTAPEPEQQAKFSVTFGSGARYQPLHEGIWRKMNSFQPLAYLGLGDNLYIDTPRFQNVQRLHYYRRMLRQEYRELIASSAIYAIWDDHDMYRNDSEGGYGLNTTDYKMPNFRVFEQNWNNPFNGIQPETPGTFFNFTIGEVEFFMTDGRFYRYGENSSKKDKVVKKHTMLGDTQKKWLLNALKHSKAKFKVLASGTMWHALADKGGKDSWAGPKSVFQKERDEIFDFINKHKINGIILISGDRHRTDIWKTDREKGYPLYEFLSAKMTNVHGHRKRKEAVWSYASKERFWGQLDFDNQAKDPTVTFKAITHAGNVLKSFPLRLSQLTHKKQ
jgi:alkaline phosphatase D